MRTRDSIARYCHGVAGGDLIDEARKMRGLPTLREERTGIKIQQDRVPERSATDSNRGHVAQRRNGTAGRAPVRFGPKNVRR
jgi:hypothetical protein